MISHTNWGRSLLFSRDVFLKHHHFYISIMFRRALFFLGFCHIFFYVYPRNRFGFPGGPRTTRTTSQDQKCQAKHRLFWSWGSISSIRPRMSWGVRMTQYWQYHILGHRNCDLPWNLGLKTRPYIWNSHWGTWILVCFFLVEISASKWWIGHTLNEPLWYTSGFHQQEMVEYMI